MTTNRVAVITGGASGIGRETCKVFAKKGDRVIVADYNEQGGLETVEQIKQAGGAGPVLEQNMELYHRTIQINQHGVALASLLRDEK